MKALIPLLTTGAVAALTARRAPDDRHGEVAVVTGASRGLGLLLLNPARPRKAFARLTTLGRAAAARFNEQPQ